MLFVWLYVNTGKNYILIPWDENQNKIFKIFSFYLSNIHTHIHTYIHTYIHAYIHTYMHTYILTYIHACILSAYIHDTYMNALK